MSGEESQIEIQSGSQLSALICDHISKNYKNQQEFAGRLGVALNTVSRWNSGQLNPVIGSNAEALAQELGVTVEDLAKLGDISVRGASEVVIKAWELADAVMPSSNE